MNTSCFNFDSFFSLSLCVSQEFVEFFRESLDRKVCWADRLEFINGWYILLIVSDILTITGSIIKIGIESKVCPCLVVTNMNNILTQVCYRNSYNLPYVPHQTVIFSSLVRICPPMTYVASSWGPPLSWCGWESFATSLSSRSTM